MRDVRLEQRSDETDDSERATDGASNTLCRRSG